jgi:DNA polymerase-3 subunit delta'
MSWGSVRGHDRVVASLRRAAEGGRLPHALLFVGPEGVGKRLFAQTLAQALLCERSRESAFEPCGACPACHQVAAGSHPDVLTVSKPEDRHELPIDAIRQLNHDLALAPMRGRRRLAIVDDADDLSDEASNAFLKTLEEPPPGAVLILVGTAPELQLDTILSRCRVVRFEPLAEADLGPILLAQGLASTPAEAAALAARAEGSVSRAAGLADPALGPFRRELIAAVSSPRGFDAPALARKLEAFSKEAGKESAAVRGRASLLAGELARFFRLALWQSAGQIPPSHDPDDRKAALELGRRLSPESASRLIERCLDADYHIARKAYLPLVFDALMHDLSDVLRPAAHSESRESR